MHGGGRERRRIAGRAVTIETIGPRPPRIVFLHEGLGSIDLWRSFPNAVVDRVARSALVYDRAGHGRSEAPPEPRSPRYLHEAALEELPGVLSALDVRTPLLLGHSDGASIALIHAAHNEVAGVIAIAPHLYVEGEALRGIRAIDAQAEGLVSRLDRHHEDAPALYRAWRDTWLSPAFRSWNIERDVAAIEAPILAIQGSEDEYASLDQLGRLEALGAGPVDSVIVDGAGHSPHLSHSDVVLDLVAAFVTEVGL